MNGTIGLISKKIQIRHLGNLFNNLHFILSPVEIFYEVIIVMLRFVFLPKHFYRWKRGKGDAVSKFNAQGARQSSNYSYWQPSFSWDEDFDYGSRSRSPLSQAAFEACSSVPTFDCSLQQEGQWTCGSVENCPSLKGNKKGLGHCSATEKDKCTVPTGTKLLSILADLRLIRESTSESLPSCMAMYGPDVVESLAGEILEEVDGCAPLFNVSIHEDDHGFFQWVNVNCERRTRALICTVLGR